MSEQTDEPAKLPKAFISYSWTTPVHQNQIVEWADRLISEGRVEVIIDEYDFKEGHDKFVFMERMVNDPSVTHVLVFSDRVYSEKADGRQGGVGTESQIISGEVYRNADQSKFIPLVCEYDDHGDPCLPTFLRNRKYIDFSSMEKVNENWEKLVRLLHGKPLRVKPELGKLPAYLSEENRLPASPASARFATLKTALLQGRKGIAVYRSDFLDACIQAADALRVRSAPSTGDFGEQVLRNCKLLVPIRNHLADWVLLESAETPPEEFSSVLNSVLERLLGLKTRPAELKSYNDDWFDAHVFFVYETFFYIIAALLKREAVDSLREVFSTHYFVRDDSRSGTDQFERFDAFYGYARSIKSVVISPSGADYLCPSAELIKRQADRTDLPFTALMEADALVFLQALLDKNMRWFPQTLVYAGYSRPLQFFLRATQHKTFKQLAAITNVSDADTLRQKTKDGMDRMNVDKWNEFSYHSNVNLWMVLNMDKLDVLS